MAYILPDDSLCSELFTAILKNQNSEQLKLIMNNHLRVDGLTNNLPISLDQELFTEKGLNEFWRLFLKQKIKIFNDKKYPFTVELTPLQLAARNGNLELVEYLVKQYPDDDKNPILFDFIKVNSLTDNNNVTVEGITYFAGFNALLLAVYHGNIDVAKYLLSLNPALESQSMDANFNTLLHWATKLGYREKLSLAPHAKHNAQGQTPYEFERDHHQQAALNSIRDARKNKQVEESEVVQKYLNDLEKNLDQLDQLMNELKFNKFTPDMSDIANYTNGIVSDIIGEKFLQGHKLNEDRLAQYKNEMATKIAAIADYDATSKKWMVFAAVVIGAIITILLALTVVGLVAEFMAVGFWAGITAAVSPAALLGGSITVGSTTVAGAGAATSTLLGSTFVGGGAGLYLSNKYYKNQGPHMINTIESDLEKIQTHSLKV